MKQNNDFPYKDFGSLTPVDKDGNPLKSRVKEISMAIINAQKESKRPTTPLEEYWYFICSKRQPN